MKLLDTFDMRLRRFAEMFTTKIEILQKEIDRMNVKMNKISQPDENITGNSRVTFTTLYYDTTACKPTPVVSYEIPTVVLETERQLVDTINILKSEIHGIQLRLDNIEEYLKGLMW